MDIEARSRPGSILSVIESEVLGLEALNDERLQGALGALSVARAEIVAALAALDQPPRNGSR